MNRRELMLSLAAGAASATSLHGMQNDRKQPQSQLPDARPRPAHDSPIRSGDAGDMRRIRDARWTPERAFRYIEPYGPIKGCNYVNRNGGVINIHECQAKTSSICGDPMQGGSECCPLGTLDSRLIEKELAWARDTVGLNSMRIWAPCYVYQADREKFFDQFERFLQVAARNGISVMPVTDVLSVRDPDLDPNLPAEETLNFVPGVHGGGWHKQGRIGWSAQWDRMKPIIKEYLQSFLSRYANDKRIVLWDLCNEAPINARALVEWLFTWVREVNPSQPLSVCWQGHDLSDIITFHTYSRPGYPSENSPGGDFTTELEWAAQWGRPMLCTECLARPFENTPQTFLPFFGRYRIGWYVWGLAAGGPAQYQYPWGWPMGSPSPDRWFHYLLYPDGRPYSAEEILMIRDFKYMRPAEMGGTQSFWRNENGEIVDTPPK